MNRLLLLPLIFCFFIGKTQQDTISFFHVYEHILNNTDYADTLEEYDELGEISDRYVIYEIQNKTISVHNNLGGALFDGDSLVSSKLNSSLSIHVNAHLPIESRVFRLHFKNCVFPNFIHFVHHNYTMLTFENCTFYDDIHINDCELGKLSFSNCTFKGKKLELLRNDISGNVSFTNNSFQELNFFGMRENVLVGELLLDENKCSQELDVWLKDNSFSNRLAFIESDFWLVTLQDNDFYSTEADTHDNTYRGEEFKVTSNERLIFLNSHSGNEFPTSFYLLNNNFESETGTEELILGGTFTDILFLENDINWRVELSNSTVEKSFWIESNVFNSDICIDSFIFSEMLNSVSWEQLEGFKISTFLYNGEYSSPKQYGRITGLPIVMKGKHADMGKPQAKHLIRSYKTIYDICKKNGDIESANGCYAEMKQVETRRWKYLFEQNKTFESFFRWQLNSFLSYFTDYGTNPAKAVIKSGWVILLFAIFYLFFPSDWDVSNRSQLLSKVKDLASKNREKSYIATLAFVAYSAFIHILNTLTLSLNAFTTLGFGDIPTHGAARYVTIVQGFIGWFLLTIFSVSLINQVLG